ncbi:MAG: YfiR family protein [Ginsengibacter sp.]
MNLKRFILLLFTGFVYGTVMAQLSEQEANLKAAFIYNFTKYIDWGNYNDRNEFVIDVLGDTIIANSLEQIAKEKTINDKPIVVHVLENPSQAVGCDILFISKNCRFTLDKILPLVGKGVLTISEQPGYAWHGTAFNFIIVNNKLKFEANLKAISSAGLKAGSQLLKLAKIIE